MIMTVSAFKPPIVLSSKMRAPMRPPTKKHKIAKKYTRAFHKYRVLRSRNELPNRTNKSVKVPVMLLARSKMYCGPPSMNMQLRIALAHEVHETDAMKEG